MAVTKKFLKTKPEVQVTFEVKVDTTESASQVYVVGEFADWEPVELKKLKNGGIHMSTVTLDNKTILVTGAAGFIGSNLVKRIYQEAPSAMVIGIDNMNAYYDVALKEFRLNELAKYPTFTFVKGNIADKELITELFEKYKPSVVVNLAAQAGVRYSITNPDAYIGIYQTLPA